MSETPTAYESMDQTTSDAESTMLLPDLQTRRERIEFAFARANEYSTSLSIAENEEARLLSNIDYQRETMDSIKTRYVADEVIEGKNEAVRAARLEEALVSVEAYALAQERERDAQRLLRFARATKAQRERSFRLWLSYLRAIGAEID